MEKILNDLLSLVVPIAKNIIYALLILVIGFKIIGVISKKLKAVKKKESKKKKKDTDTSASGFLISFITISLKTIVIISVIGVLGVPMSSVVALVASAGVAIGLAVQGALSNFVGGIMILMFKPFKEGDYIEAQNVSGTVKEISVIYTSLLTPDNKFITVPNGSLTNSVIVNYSTEELRRVDVVVTASYEADIEMVKSILMGTIEDCEGIISEPKPNAVVTEYAPNGVGYALRVWCKNEDYWNVKFKLTENVRNAFRDADIEIPVQKMDIKIKKD